MWARHGAFILAVPIRGQAQRGVSALGISKTYCNAQTQHAASLLPPLAPLTAWHEPVSDVAEQLALLGPIIT
jgi:hypothetical protein